ncbi:unnamed protein product [Diatraea saccharalis]|uniref:Uncharacterized protein n=1 Tax=Diatraea saccharalis TaxID=40085 RepID=A0A9N9WJU4_9NEOP|nr:unnamed protein product [Diatraea saccharalis]
MKVLLTLAFVAIATAIPMPEPIRLQDAQQPIGISTLPLFIPAELAEAFNKDLELNPPINSMIEPIVLIEAPQPEVYDDVVVVLEETNPAEETVPTAVKFVDSPVAEEVAPSAEDSPVAEEVAPTAVRFVDSPVEEVAPTAVRFVDSPVEEEVAPIRFVDSPVEEEISPSGFEYAKVSYEDIEPTAVRFVDNPVEESDAAVELAESAIGEIAPTPVRFVDAPIEEKAVPSPIKIANIADIVKDSVVVLSEDDALESYDGPQYPHFKYDNDLLR